MNIRIWLRVVSILALFTSLPSRCYSGELEERAGLLAEEYMLLEEFGLTDFLMEIELWVESSPDSEVLFTSRGRMSYFRQGNTTMSRVQWVPKLLDDLRQGLSRNEVTPFMSHTSQIDLNIDEKLYLVHNQNLVGKDSNPEAYSYFKSVVMVPMPFDWPLHSFATFHKSGNRGLGKLTFEKKICFLAREKNDEIESYWALPVQSPAFTKICFKNDLVTKFEVFMLPEKTKVENIEVDGKKNAKTNSVTTKWKQFEDGFVPEEVHSVFTRSPGNTSTTFEVSSKLKFFGKSTPEYKQMGEDINKILKLPELPLANKNP